MTRHGLERASAPPTAPHTNIPTHTHAPRCALTHCLPAKGAHVPCTVTPRCYCRVLPHAARQRGARVYLNAHNRAPRIAVPWPLTVNVCLCLSVCVCASTNVRWSQRTGVPKRTPVRAAAPVCRLARDPAAASRPHRQIQPKLLSTAHLVLQRWLQQPRTNVWETP